MPARAFAEYELLARIATGGTANIFLGRRRVDNGFQILCLKAALPERGSNKDLRQALENEGRLGARLDHPACVRLLALGRERGTDYLAIEHIFGETLGSLMAKARDEETSIPPAIVATICARIAAGLHHAHEARGESGSALALIHRDVSPQNVMLSYDGEVKVLDFGIAKAANSAATHSGVVKGKQGYMSPEQITGAPLDRRTDIYSLGIILFECLTTTRLFSDVDGKEVAWKMFKETLPLPSQQSFGLDQRFDPITQRALATDKDQRYATAQEMATALEPLRAPSGAADLAAFLRRQFPDRFSTRRRLLERLRSGEFDEREVLRVFDARPVLEVDLFQPEGQGDTGSFAIAVEHSSITSLASRTFQEPAPTLLSPPRGFNDLDAPTLGAEDRNPFADEGANRTERAALPARFGEEHTDPERSGARAPFPDPATGSTQETPVHKPVPRPTDVRPAEGRRARTSSARPRPPVQAAQLEWAQGAEASGPVMPFAPAGPLTGPDSSVLTPIKPALALPQTRSAEPPIVNAPSPQSPRSTVSATLPPLMEAPSAVDIKALQVRWLLLGLGAGFVLGVLSIVLLILARS